MGKKGKAQGRAGQKKKAQKASHNNTPRSSPWTQDFSRGKNALLYDDSEDDDFPRTSFRGFTGASPRTPHSIDPNVKLRHRTIAFVSAGTNTPAEKEEEVEAEVSAQVRSSEVNGDAGLGEDIDDGDDDIQTNIVIDVDMTVPRKAMQNMAIDSPPRAKEPETSSQNRPLFVVDTVGDDSLATAAQPTTKPSAEPFKASRSPSPTPSNSSEEVVFAGRGTAASTATLKSAPKPAITTKNVQPIPADHDAVFNSKPQPRPRQWVTKTETPVPNSALPSTVWGNNENAGPSEPLLKWQAYKQQQRERSQGPSTTSDAWVPAPEVPYWKTGGQYTGVAQTASIPTTNPPAATSSSIARPNANARANSRAIALVDFDGASDDVAGMNAPRANELVRASPRADGSIAELKAEWKKTLSDKRKAGSKDSGNGTRRGKRGRKKGNRLLRGEDVMWDSDEGLSEAAYDDYMANLAAQMDADEMEGLTQTEFVSGASMMVDGKEYGDAEKLDRKSHVYDHRDENEGNGTGVIEETVDSSDEEISKHIGLDFDGGSGEDDSEWASEGSSELEDELEYTERQQWEDEADLRQRRLEAKTDEQIARLWAKQAQLGIQADELVIDDGEYDSGQYGDLVAARAGLGSVGFTTTPRRKGKGKSNGLAFPNASALANTLDQYGEAGFDIMDLDRPSLRPTKKGRKGNLPPEIEAMSDEDGFKDELVDQWDRDRSKKKLKKLEREELRAQGLLGKKGVADLGQKYRDGMTIVQIKEELRIFLDGDSETRAFPPMAKRDRANLHEIVSALGMKSKSHGSGKNRFPVLYKTRMTSYDDDLFERIFGLASRGQVGFMGNKGRSKLAAKKGRGGAGGGFDKSSTTLRNGEVVGAGAPEIANTSFGHKLMEKMGWSKGTALGKDGEGRLMPVEQVMRSGKAGLG